MPELPEVETMCRGIRGVVGARIVGLARARCRLKPILVVPRIPAFRRRAVGRRVVAVERLGKRVVVRLDNRAGIVFEPRMTGLVLVADPPDRRFLRFELRLAGSRVERLCYWDRRGLGSVRLFSEPELHSSFGPDQLGPDALMVTAIGLRESFCRSRREIKVALLDQRSLAGIGNLYASEILHLARVHPQRPCDRLSRDQWDRVHAAMRHVLHEAIRYEGSTLADGTYRNALNQTGTYQNRHRVYGRAGERCPACGQAKIERIVQAQRATFLCPRCQRRPRRRK